MIELVVENTPTHTTTTSTTQSTSKLTKRLDPPSSQEEYNGCPICFENWAALGDHRMASLKCGHIFGLSCIEQWLRNGKRSTCPQCNEPTKRQDIRLLFAPTNLRIQDNSKEKKQEQLIEVLEAKIQSLKSDLLLLNLALKEKEICLAEMTKTKTKNTTSTSFFSFPTFIPHKDTVALSLNGESRHMAYCDYSKLLLITITTRSNGSKKSSGVVRVNLMGTASAKLTYDYLPLHQAPIKGIEFSPHSDGLLLSASLDSRLLLSDPSKSSILLEYSLPRPAWCCAWDPIERSYCWAGLSDGSLLLFDLRSIKDVKHSFTSLLNSNPIQSITFITGCGGCDGGCSDCGGDSNNHSNNSNSCKNTNNDSNNKSKKYTRNIILGTFKGPFLLKIANDSFKDFIITPYVPQSSSSNSPSIGRWGLLESKICGGVNDNNNHHHNVVTLGSLRNPTEHVLYSGKDQEEPILVCKIPSLQEKSMTLCKGSVYCGKEGKENILIVATPDGRDVRVSLYDLPTSSSSSSTSRIPNLQYLLPTDMKSNVVCISIKSYGEEVLMFVLCETTERSPFPKRKVAILLGYDGTEYQGMQLNPAAKTIELALFDALCKDGLISPSNKEDPHKISWMRSCRTDKGVHAAGQLLSVKLLIKGRKSMPLSSSGEALSPEREEWEQGALEEMKQRLNDLLPRDIRIYRIIKTISSFHAKERCDSRRYEYLLPTYSFSPSSPAVISLYKEGKSLKTRDTCDNDGVNVGVSGTNDGVNADISGEKKSNNDINDINDISKAVSNTKEWISTLKEDDFEFMKNYRLPQDRKAKIVEALSMFKGTKNFFNFTIKKDAKELNARRHMFSVELGEPFIKEHNSGGSGGSTTTSLEWIPIRIHGQSFMLHQIRKMVGLLIMLIRLNCSLSLIERALDPSKEKINIPKAPSLGLLLDKAMFEHYNKMGRVQGNKGAIEWESVEGEREDLKNTLIYPRMWEEEATYNRFMGWISCNDDHAGEFPFLREFMN